MPTKMTTDGIQRIGRQSASAAAADAIRAAILNGDLLMGQVLSEVALGESLGVSRTPLREALLELEGQGLIQMAHYKGTRVFSLTSEQIAQLGAFRAMLELAALDAAMEADPDALVAALSPIIEEMNSVDNANDAKRLGRLDTKLHECIIAQSHNEYLISAYHIVALKLAVLRMLVSRDEATLQSSNDDHACLLSHLRKGYFSEARALLMRHIKGGTEFYVSHTHQALQLRVVGQ